jgi:hypothetical protein
MFPSQTTDPSSSFSGTYSANAEGVGSTLTLEQDAQGNVRGRLLNDDLEFVLAGRVEQEPGGGAFVTGQASSPTDPTLQLTFEAHHVQGYLLLQMSLMGGWGMPAGTPFAQFIFPLPPMRTQPVAPLPVRPRAEPPQPTRPPAGGTARPEPASRQQPLGQVFRHPIGLRFEYPQGWRTQEGGGMLQLIPPDQGHNAMGATETYVVSANPAAGLTGPDDPRLIQTVEAHLAQLPFLVRQGGGEPVSTASGAPGISLRWEGVNPMGKTIQARLYLTLLGEYAVAVMGLGEAERLAARESLVRAIFTSLEREAGGLDPELVGTWHYLSTLSYLNRDLASRPTMTGASDTNRFVQLGPDGRATRTEKHRAIFNIPGMSLDTGDSVTTSAGRWNAANGRIVLLWENGETNEFQYRFGNSVQGRTLELVGANGNVQVWGQVH